MAVELMGGGGGNYKRRRGKNCGPAPVLLSRACVMAALVPTPRVAGSITSDCSLTAGSGGQLSEGTQLAINCEEVKLSFT